MEAVTAVRYVKSAIPAGVMGKKIFERTPEERPLARPFSPTMGYYHKGSEVQFTGNPMPDKI